MGAMAFQIASLTIVYSTAYLGADQRKHQSSASLAFCAGNSPVIAQMASNAEMFPFDDAIMYAIEIIVIYSFQAINEAENIDNPYWPTQWTLDICR